MKIARFRMGDRARYGAVEGDEVREIAGSPFDGVRLTGAVHPLRAVTLLAPVVPSKALATIRNYASHAVGPMGLPDSMPREPRPSLKPPPPSLGLERPYACPRTQAGWMWRVSW